MMALCNGLTTSHFLMHNFQKGRDIVSRFDTVTDWQLAIEQINLNNKMFTINRVHI